MPEPIHILWFRQNLRLADNPALLAAAEGGAVLPVYIFSPEEEGDWPPGAAARWWRDRSLLALRQRLRELGGDLVVRHGNAAAVLDQLAAETGASAVFWQRRYEPAAIARQEDVRRRLRIRGYETGGNLLCEPWELANQAGAPYQVFTPFWRRFAAEVEVAAPLPAPARLTWPTAWPAGEDWEPAADPARWGEHWTPGEAAGLARLGAFLRNGLADYPAGRERPDVDGSSRLSPWLHHGDLSIRQVWHAAGTTDAPAAAVESFRRELAWREFAHHLLYHFPQTPLAPLHEQYTAFPWRDDAAALTAWQEGRTGFPIVDAGMRQLRDSGWMHNRVRMIAASFLVKDLLLPWQAGARWFWDRLVDADLANNTLGWQWAAGCGADAAPYFRIFNPVTQGRKFDPAGAYVREWVTELRDLPPGADLQEPRPGALVDHAAARQRALAAYERVKGH